MRQETEEQKQARFKQWGDRELNQIESGGCTHTPWTQKDISIGDQLIHKISPVVRLSNDDDPYYCQTFKTRVELEEFIAKLRECAREAWGEPEPISVMDAYK